VVACLAYPVKRNIGLDQISTTKSIQEINPRAFVDPNQVGSRRSFGVSYLRRTRNHWVRATQSGKVSSVGEIEDVRGPLNRTLFLTVVWQLICCT
jgi:hypothetical protein